MKGSAEVAEIEAAAMHAPTSHRGMPKPRRTIAALEFAESAAGFTPVLRFDHDECVTWGDMKTSQTGLSFTV
jgi:hypothetical protein